MEVKYFVVDTFAWIEYLKGSESGLKLFDLLKNKENEFFTPLTVLAELKDYCMSNREDFNEAYRIVGENSRIMGLSEEDVIEAGKNHFELKKKIKNWGYMDSLILASFRKARKTHKNTKIVTGDRHFKQFNFTKFIR
jgi:predicted nucleic acid-binding protein